MEWVVPLVVGLLGFLGGSGVERLRLTGRLRANIAAEQAIAKDLPPDGKARKELDTHIERQVCSLVAEETPSSAHESRNQRQGTGFLLLGVLGLAAALYLDATTGPMPFFLSLLWTLTGVGTCLIGFRLIRSARRSRESRRMEARRNAEAPAAPPPTSQPLA